MIDAIDKRINRALRNVRHAFRGTLSLLDTAKRISKAQLTGIVDETLNNIEMFQHFGFSSAPPADSEVIVLPILGRSRLSVIIASENGKYRFKGLLTGESVLYSQYGDYVRIHKGRIVEVKAAAEVKIDAPLATMTGNLKVTGNIESGGDIKDQHGTMQAMRTVYNQHAHSPDGVTPKMLVE